METVSHAGGVAREDCTPQILHVNRTELVFETRNLAVTTVQSGDLSNHHIDLNLKMAKSRCTHTKARA
jgi:hypothetical protein